MIKHVKGLPVVHRLNALVLGVIQRSDLSEIAVLSHNSDHRDHEAENGLQHDVQREEATEVLLHETEETAMLSGGKGSMEEGEEADDDQGAGHGMGDHVSLRLAIRIVTLSVRASG